MKLRIRDDNWHRHVWWTNFCHSVSGDTVSVRIAARDSILAEYRAKFTQPMGSRAELEFESEEDAILFLLRWS